MKKNYKHRNTPPEVYGYDPERDSKILELYKSGKTLQNIGDEYKLTRERVRQVVFRALIKYIKKGLKEGYYENSENKKIISLAKEELVKLKENNSQDKIISKINVGKDHGIVPDIFNSKSRYSKAVGISLRVIRKYSPETISRLNENITVGLGGRKWSRHYIKCRLCGTDDLRHRSWGYCEGCYSKSEIFKEIQESSRLRNGHKWKTRQLEYYKQYRNLKALGGNKLTVLERDNFICVSCGMSDSDSQLNYKEHLRVVHIKETNNHELTNLSTLCRKCCLKHIRSKH
jgi:hypothetical protein